MYKAHITFNFLTFEKSFWSSMNKYFQFLNLEPMRLSNSGLISEPALPYLYMGYRSYLYFTSYLVMLMPSEDLFLIFTCIWSIFFWTGSVVIQNIFITWINECMALKMSFIHYIWRYQWEIPYMSFHYASVLPCLLHINYFFIFLI